LEKIDENRLWNSAKSKQQIFEINDKIAEKF